MHLTVEVKDLYNKNSKILKKEGNLGKYQILEKYFTFLVRQH